MPRADISLSLPESVWIGAITRQHPEFTVRVLSAMPDAEGGGHVVAELYGDDLDAGLEAVESSDAVANFSPLQRTEHNAIVQFETAAATLLRPVLEAGVPLETPFEISNGSVEWTLTGSRDRLSALVDRLNDVDAAPTVNSIERAVDTEDLLTDKQRETLETGVETGYYATPRETTLTELAEEMGVAKSTLSETLHRAEGTVISEFVGGDDR